MSNVDKEVFNFFTTENNFLTMCKVVHHYESVKKKLLIEFWNLVMNKLNELNQNTNNKWSIEITGDVSDRRTKILIFKKTWTKEVNKLPLVAAGYERLAQNNWPFLGLWINNDAKNVDIKSLLDYARKIPEYTEYEDDDDNWWPFWKETELDFSEDEAYLRILPENRNALVDCFAIDLIDFANEFERIMDELILMGKNGKTQNN